MIDDDSAPTNYYRAFEDIRDSAAGRCDHRQRRGQYHGHRTYRMPNNRPRSRLDAGSYGTMGVGLGFAVAAAVVHRDRPVVAVEGDSGFGFSGMEVETLCRYRLPVKILILNNGGIGFGADELPTDRPVPAPLLTPRARYDLMMEAFGGRGILVEDPRDLRRALDAAMAFDGPAMVNVILDPRAGRNRRNLPG